jgi:hypothetical protein
MDGQRYSQKAAAAGQDDAVVWINRHGCGVATDRESMLRLPNQPQEQPVR